MSHYGPWRMEKAKIIHTADGPITVHEIFDARAVSVAVSWAVNYAQQNGVLIAAAPSLLAECERLLKLVESFNRWHPCGEYEDAIEAANKAIAAAKEPSS